MSSHDSFMDSSAPTNNNSETQHETRMRRLSLLMPLLLNIASRNQISLQESGSESGLGPEMNNDSRTRFTVIMVDRRTGAMIVTMILSRTRFTVIMVDRRTGAMIVMEGSGDIDNLFEHVSSKSGVSPASKASIEIHEAGAECAICLETYEVESEAREMPCTHRFHSGCIEKWLGIHGSCPMCRFEMPAEKTDSNSGGVSEEGEDGDESVEAVLNFRLWVRDEPSERSDPMDVDIGSGSGAEAVGVDLNRPYEDSDGDADDLPPEINLE